MKVNKNISAWMLVASMVLVGSVQQVRATLANELSDAKDKVLNLINQGKITKAADAAERKEWSDAFAAWEGKLNELGVSSEPELLTKLILNIKDGADVDNAKKQIALLAGNSSQHESIRHRIEEILLQLDGAKGQARNHLQSLKHGLRDYVLPVANAAAKQL